MTPYLLIRPNAQDAKLLPNLLAVRKPALPRLHVVLDAHVAARSPELTVGARDAGSPLLVDPQTYLLQDRQHASDPWCALPFATASPLLPDMFQPERLDALIRDVVAFQVRQGASSIIPPYFFLGRNELGWADVQARVWRGTRAALDDLDVKLPVTAVTSVDWSRLRGMGAFAPDEELDRALRDLAPNEVAVASSKSHLGARPEERVLDLCAAITRLSRIAPVIAWHQGILGEACVAAGAQGYESGIGQREALDLPSSMASRRNPPTGGPRSPRSVFVKGLMRSIPKKAIQALSDNRRLWPSIFCLDSDCCLPNGQSMLGDARSHSVRARRESLAELASVKNPAWRWGALADRTEHGLTLAERINRSGDGARVNSGPLRGMHIVAEGLRHGTGAIRIA